MNTGMKVLLACVVGFFGILIAGGVGVGGYLYSTYDGAVDLETQVKYQYEDLQNVKSNYTLKIQEMVQVNDIYKDDLKEIVESTFQGRYGKDGSKAMMQWIQERNIDLDPQLYRNLQITMDAGRTEFQNKQTRLLDTKRMYEKRLAKLISGFALNLMSFPKIDMDKYSPIIDEGVRDQFVRGVDEGITLR